jgi:hypothetical protein
MNGIITSELPNTRLAAGLTLLLATLLVSACGSGSGASTSTNPVTTTAVVSNYNGPAPQTADVQAFKINVWDNLVPDNRCGNCHQDTQSPRFVRADDINLAYNEANTIVDLTDPANSRMVLKVRGGHNCWETSDDACADTIQRFIEAWAGGALGGPGKEVELIAPVLIDPGSSRNFPEDSGLFGVTVYPLLRQYCAGCHTDEASVPQSPFFASSDVDVAYEAAKTKIDLETPSNSRFVIRLRDEFHNCWDNCQANATEMQTEIQAMSDGITPTSVDADLLISKAMKLVDGIIASSGGRHEANVIALYEFKTGEPSVTAFDTSGVTPALNLTLSSTGVDWVGGWGIRLTGGKAQGSTSASAKLHDLIKATGEYSVEAWIAPANVTQDGPARIISYSGGVDSRNFTLGQTLYNYDFLNRTVEAADPNGQPALSTADADEDLQATLQHVVINFDPANGRSIYVNGEHTGDIDSLTGGSLADWENIYALAIGAEVDGSNTWEGTVRLLAIHNRILTPQQIQQNFEVGVGEKYFLLFNVSDRIGVTDAYVVFEVSQYDSYSYLFNTPFFILLDPAALPGDIPLQGMRIGINGREVEVGQAYQNIDVLINDTTYSVEGRQYLSNLGTVIGLEKGPEDDEFFLSFERLGTETNVVIEAPPPIPAAPASVPVKPGIGVRDFAEVNATMSVMTGIPTTHSGVTATYNLVYQALPVATGIQGFVSSQQMGITQLAIQYCSALVDDSTARQNYFVGFDFSADVSTAFDATGRAQIIDPLLANMIGNTNLGTQPDHTDVTTEVNWLITELTNCGGTCLSDQTERVVKGACASVLGGAAMLVQ